MVVRRCSMPSACRSTVVQILHELQAQIRQVGTEGQYITIGVLAAGRTRTCGRERMERYAKAAHAAQRAK